MKNLQERAEEFADTFPRTGSKEVDDTMREVIIVSFKKGWGSLMEIILEATRHENA